MTRYEELFSLYFDGEPTDAELTELAELLKNDEKLAHDFREELVIWEAWSQEMAPERSADAFLAGFHTRLRAEEDAGTFELSVSKQLKERRKPFLWKPLIPVAAILVILLSLGVFFNPADIDTGLIATAEASSVHIHGECICLRCTLKSGGRCAKAIRYTDDEGNTKIIQLVNDPEHQKYNQCFCGGPTQVLVEGEFIEQNGAKALLATTLKIEDQKISEKM